MGIFKADGLGTGKTVTIAAQTDDEGANPRLLDSIFQREEQTPIEIALKGVPASGSANVAVIDADGFKETQIDYSDGVLKLDSKDSGVYLVRF